MSYETKTLRLRTSDWLLLSVDNAGDFEVASRGQLPIMLFVGTVAPAAGFRSDLVTTAKALDGLGDAKVWGKAIGQDTLVTVMRQANAGNVEPVVLQPLQLSATSFLTSLVEGSEIGTFANKASGSTVRLKRGTGSTALNGDGTKVLRGDKPTDGGKFKETFVETHPLAVNDALETEVEFTATLPPPPVNALALGDTIAFLGCSVDWERNWHGYVPALMQRIGWRLNMHPFGRYGWPGAKPDQFDKLLPGLLAAKPAVLWIGDWVNATVPGGAPTLESQTTAISSIMAQFGALATSKLIVLSPTRLAQATVANNNVTLSNAINAWCLAQNGKTVGNAKVLAIDAPYDVSNAGLGATHLRDTLHDNARGAIFNRAKKFADALAPVLPAGRALPVPGTPPANNVNGNPTFTGAAGGKSGSASAQISGTIANGYTVFNDMSALTVVAEAADNRQRLTVSGTISAVGNLRLEKNVLNLQRGRKYMAMVRIQVSAADGVSPMQPGLYNLSLASQIPIAIGNDGRGPMLAGYGDIPTPQRGAARPINPDTGAADDIGELWLVTEPITCPNTGDSLFRFNCIPKVGTVDMMIDFSDFYVLEVHEPKGLPYYQARRYDRGDGSYIRPFGGYLGPFSIGGFYPTFASENLRMAVANANSTWFMTPGHWSGDPDTYDGKVAVSKDSGATWTEVVASLVTGNWRWNATGYGLVAGDQVRTEITATTTGFAAVTASEIVTITA